MLDARVEQAKKKSRNSSTMKLLRKLVKPRAAALGSTRTGKVFTDGAQSGRETTGKPRLESSEINLCERSGVEHQRSNC